MRDVRRFGGGRGLREGGREKKSELGISWMILELSAITPTRGRLQPGTRGYCAGRRNKRRNVVSWRNRSLQRKPGLDCGIQ